MKATNNLNHVTTDLIEFSGGGGCFPAGTKINTLNGYRNIEDIKAGDLVYAFDDQTGEVKIGQVESINSHSWSEVHLESPLLIITYLVEEASINADGEPVAAKYGTLTLTANHWVWQKDRSSIKTDVPTNYVEARELNVGDVLAGEYNQQWRITDIKDGPEYDFVYNFEVTEYHSYIADKIRVHNGGGGKKSSRTPVEAPNTLRSRQVVRFQEIISEGEIKGVVGGAKGVFLNGTNLQNEDGTFNFTNAELQFRNGLPVQEAMSGFSASESENAAPGKVTIAAMGGQAVVSNISGASSGARLTFYIPVLSTTDLKSGDTNPTSVQFQIYRKPHGAATWELVRDETITGKCVSPYYFSYRIDKPSTPGLWDIKVQRITPDSTSQTLQNDLYWSSYTVISDVQSTYPYTAYVGVTAGADSTGNSIPLRAYDVEGILVKVPSNYNPVTRAYTGPWDGTFSTTKQFTDNPAWHVYDLLTNERYGCGDFIDESLIDVYSFYDAAVYNDQLVNDGKGTGTFEPRFRFNDQIFASGQAWNVIQGLASSFNAVVATSNAMVTLIQDRPTAVTNLITNSNVVDGEFKYTSASSSTQYNAVQVTYKDPENNNLETVVREDYPDDIAADKEKLLQLQAPGCTTEGQARRAAKWALDTSKYSTDVVEFKVTLDNSFLQLGEVIDIMDEYYSGVVQEGRVISTSGSTVVLDKPVTIGTGTWTLKTYKADGTSLDSYPITSLNQTTSTLTVTGTPTATAGAIWIVVGTVNPRPFRINSIKEDSSGIYTITASQYDAGKWQRVESGISVAPPVFIQPSDQRIVTPPLNIKFQERSYLTPEGSVRRYLDVGWQPSATDMITSYHAYYSKDAGPLVDLGTVQQPQVSILCDTSGTYRITVYANSITGRQSLPASQDYFVDLENPTPDSVLVAVTDLQVVGGGLSFDTPDLKIEWTDPNQNLLGSTIAGYKVTVMRADDSVLRTEIVPASMNSFVYALSDNIKDTGTTGTGSRVLKIKVNVVNTFQRLSAGNTKTFTNAAPAAPSFTELALLDQVVVNVVPSTGVVGYKVWLTLGDFGVNKDDNYLVYDGPGPQILLTSLKDGTPVPRGIKISYRIAAYDSFSKDNSDLNASANRVITTATSASDLNGYRNDGVKLSYNKASNKVLWTSGKITKTGGTHVGAAIGTEWTVVAGSATWTGGNLYVYFEESTTIKTSTSITDAYSGMSQVLAVYKGNDQLLDGKGSFIVDGNNILAGTIGASQLVSNSAVITGTAQIQDAVITAAKIQSVNADTITTGSLTSDRIDSRNLTIKDAAGNIILGVGNPLTGTYIANASIDYAKIKDATITSAKLSGTIQSDNFVSGSSGWRIDRTTGAAEFQDVTVRGDIRANSLTANSVVTSNLVANAISTFKTSPFVDKVYVNVTGTQPIGTPLTSLNYGRTSTTSKVFIDFSATLSFPTINLSAFTQDGHYFRLWISINVDDGSHIINPNTAYDLLFMKRVNGVVQTTAMNNSPYSRIFLVNTPLWGVETLTASAQLVVQWNAASNPITNLNANNHNLDFFASNPLFVSQEMKR